MAMVDTLVVEPNDLGITPGHYSIHNLDRIGTQFLLSSNGKLSVVSEGHTMWERSEHTDECLAGILSFKEVEIVHGYPDEYLIDIENNQVVHVHRVF